MYVLATRIGDITTDDILSFLPALFIACGLIMLISYLIIRSSNAQNNALPVTERTATIVDLRQESAMGIITTTWILFQFSDGSRVRLVIEYNNDFMVGDKGLLKYQGNKMISFERGVTKKAVQRNGVDKETPEQKMARVEVTHEEIQRLMRRKNIPYGEAVILAKKRKLTETMDDR